MLSCAVLCCAVLFGAVLCCAVLCCAVLSSGALYLAGPSWDVARRARQGRSLLFIVEVGRAQFCSDPPLVSRLAVHVLSACCVPGLGEPRQVSSYV